MKTIRELERNMRNWNETDELLKEIKKIQPNAELKSLKRVDSINGWELSTKYIDSGKMNVKVNIGNKAINIDKICLFFSPKLKILPTYSDEGIESCLETRLSQISITYATNIYFKLADKNSMKFKTAVSKYNKDKEVLVIDIDTSKNFMINDVFAARLSPFLKDLIQKNIQDVSILEKKSLSKTIKALLKDNEFKENLISYFLFNPVSDSNKVIDYLVDENSSPNFSNLDLFESYNDFINKVYQNIE